MIVGTALYAPASASQFAAVPWARVPAWAWISMVLSAVLALNVSYLIWYTSVQRIGNVRTSAYSNFIPLVAMSVAAVALGETIAAVKLAGAGAILDRCRRHADGGPEARRTRAAGGRVGPAVTRRAAAGREAPARTRSSLA